MKVRIGSLSIPSGLRLGITLIIVLMVISSPAIMLVNPASVVAAAASLDSTRVDSSNYHSTPRIADAPLTSSTPTDATTTPPSTLSQDGGDFTTQAALSLTRASQTNNFVASKAYYDISFRTATAGVIKSVVMDFPTGTSVGSALVVEATGIGPGTLAASAGEVLTYTVTNAVNVPANTIIRIQISNINNPPTPSASFTVSITTRDAAATPIDGPTPTLAYNMVQVGNAQIAPGAVTTTKIATGAVTSTDVADGAVTTPKIADGAIQPQVQLRTEAVAVSVPPNDFASGIANCMAGETAVSGGLFNDGGLLTLSNFRPEGSNGWLTEMFNSDPTFAHSFFPRVVCMPAMP